MINYRGHTGIFVEHSTLSGMGRTISLEVYHCAQCGIVFTKLDAGYFLVRKRQWTEDFYDYFWDPDKSHPADGGLWACSENDRTIQEIIE